MDFKGIPNEIHIYKGLGHAFAKEVNTNSTSGDSFPSSMSYNLIFLTAALVSAISIALVIVLRKRMIINMTTTKPQSN